MDLNSFLLHLSLIEQVGPATIEKIFILGQKLNLLPNSYREFYNFTPQDLINYGLSENISKKIVTGLKNHKILEQELELISKYNIQIITAYSKDYPELLKNIYLPPTILYVGAKNNLIDNFNNSLKKTIALVGSRKADKYGDIAIKKIVPDLIACGYTIISGGALGIDTLAHNAALGNNGATIAVLGSGLLKPYPQQNRGLFAEISNSTNSSVISPFSLNTNPNQTNFPARNRIIAGLSQATIVIQAAESSGSLITAQYALEQGREVGAIPGAIDNILSAGCNKLIAQGGAIITSAQDILDLLHDNNIIGKKKNNKNMVIPNDENNIEIRIEDKILKLAEKKISLEELAVTLTITEIEAAEILFNMQLDGLIEQDFMGFWLKK